MREVSPENYEYEPPSPERVASPGLSSQNDAEMGASALRAASEYRRAAIESGTHERRAENRPIESTRASDMLRTTSGRRITLPGLALPGVANDVSIDTKQGEPVVESTKEVSPATVESAPPKQRTTLPLPSAMYSLESDFLGEALQSPSERVDHSSRTKGTSVQADKMPYNVKSRVEETSAKPIDNRDPEIDIPLDGEPPAPKPKNVAVLKRENAAMDSRSEVRDDTLPLLSVEREVLKQPPVEPKNATIIERPRDPEQPETAREVPRLTARELVEREVPRTPEVLKRLYGDLTREWRTPYEVKLAADAYAELVDMHKTAWKELGRALTDSPVHSAYRTVDSLIRSEGIHLAWRFDEHTPPGGVGDTVAVRMRRSFDTEGGGGLPWHVKRAAKDLGVPAYRVKGFGDVYEPIGMPRRYRPDETVPALRLAEMCAPYMNEAQIVFGRGIARFGKVVSDVHPAQESLLTDLQNACTARGDMLPGVTNKLISRTWDERWHQSPSRWYPAPRPVRYLDGENSRDCFAHCIELDIKRFELLDQVVGHITKSNMIPQSFDPRVGFGSLGFTDENGPVDWSKYLP